MKPSGLTIILTLTRHGVKYHLTPFPCSSKKEVLLHHLALSSIKFDANGVTFGHFVLHILYILESFINGLL